MTWSVWMNLCDRAIIANAYVLASPPTWKHWTTIDIRNSHWTDILNWPAGTKWSFPWTVYSEGCFPVICPGWPSSCSCSHTDYNDSFTCKMSVPVNSQRLDSVTSLNLKPAHEPRSQARLVEFTPSQTPPFALVGVRISRMVRVQMIGWIKVAMATCRMVISSFFSNLLVFRHCRLITIIKDLIPLENLHQLHRGCCCRTWVSGKYCKDFQSKRIPYYGRANHFYYVV